MNRRLFILRLHIRVWRDYLFALTMRTVILLSVLVAAPVLIFWTVLFDNLTKEKTE